MRRIAAVYEGFDIKENFFAAYAPYNNRILGLGQFFAAYAAYDSLY
jgi:hypothetical protein